MLCLALHITYYFIETYIILPFKRRSFQKRQPGKTLPRELVANSLRTKASDTFRDTIVDVQKTLVFFFSSIISAAFITASLRKGGSSYTDVLLLLILTLTGMYSISFVMLCIMLYRKGSWYILTLTSAAWILCFVFALAIFSGHIVPHADLNMGLNSCDHELYTNADMAKVEFAIRTGRALKSKEYKIPSILSSLWSVIIMVICICWQSKMSWSRTKVGYTLKKVLSPKRMQVLEISGIALLVLTFLAIFAYIMNLLISRFSRIVTFDKSSWSFGQVVAVGIWLPVIVDCMFSSITEPLALGL